MYYKIAYSDLKNAVIYLLACDATVLLLLNRFFMSGVQNGAVSDSK